MVWRKNIRSAAGLFFGVALAAATASCLARGAFCEQCGRKECRNLTFTVRLEDGKDVETCCPRCALHYIKGERPAVASLQVRDFDDAEVLDATRALYVEGSDVQPCAAGSEGPRRNEHGCCLARVYDRCLPSLLAFRSESRAEAFTREHGGAVRTFAELEAGIR